MKKPCLFVLFLIMPICIFGQSIIFLHHSTGEGVYNGGVGLHQWFADYNTKHSLNYSISELAYPNTPYNWENYPFDYWNLWVNPGNCDNTKSGIRCLDWFTSNYNVIVFKHCFPGAGISADTGNPDISSSTKSIENYKLQYRALRGLMDSYPNNKFIIWTLAPLHRNATNTESAARARQFVNWVKNEWLNEDLKTHPNIFIFDFFDYVAETNPTPSHGKVNCLKYEYEGDHNGDDSHPNATANSTIMPLFGQFIVDVIQNKVTSSVEVDGIGNLEIKFHPNPARSNIKIDGTSNCCRVEILDISGKLIKRINISNGETDVSFLPKGNYIIRVGNQSKFKSQLLVIE
jgi:hypothetical protein